MPVVIEEKFGSPQIVTGDNPSVTRSYIISGTADEIEAKDELEAFAPDTELSLPRLEVQVDPLAATWWEGVVRWGLQQSSPPPDTGDSTFAFDTGGGTQRITHSPVTVGYAPPGGTAPNFQGAIGVTDNGVEGVDITLPIYHFSETHYLAAAVVDEAYKNTLFALTGQVNDASFKGLAAGECLFLGAAGTRRGTDPDDDWEITFRFAGSLNATGLSVGPITGIDKKGWQYLWVRYAETEDANAKVIVQRPIAAYVEDVYKSGNFAALGIGT